MTVHPILLILWAALAAAFFGLLIYRGQLTRYEDEQLFLTDDNLNEKEQQSRIVKRIQKLEPIVNIAGGAAGLITLCVVGSYVFSAWQSLQQ